MRIHLMIIIMKTKYRYLDNQEFYNFQI